MNKDKYLLSLFIINLFIKLYLIFYFSENLNFLFKGDSSNYLDIFQFLQKDFLNYFSTPFHSHRSPGYPFFLFLLSKLYNNFIFFIFVQFIISFYTLFVTYKICSLVVKNSKKNFIFFYFIKFLIYFIFFTNFNRSNFYTNFLYIYLFFY